MARRRRGELEVVKAANAGTPITSGQTPLPAVDVWEHEHYPDCQNRRKDYLTAVVDGLLSSEFASKNLPGA